MARYALTPADLWDHHEALARRKHAEEGASSGVTTSSSSAPPAATKYKPQKPAPSPGDYKATYLDNSGLGAQASSVDLFQTGSERSLPVSK